MKLLAINGGKRTNHSTGLLLNKAIESAASAGADTEVFNLFDMNYQGCVSCFGCKLKNGKSYGRCARKDALSPILKKAEQADSILMASPIYFRTVTGAMKSFIERLIFPYVTYTTPMTSLFNRNLKTAFIYTMNNTESEMKMNGIDKHLQVFSDMARLAFGYSEVLYSFDTYQFDDYSKYVSERFDPVKKLWVRENVFPLDIKKAGELGRRLVT